MVYSHSLTLAWTVSTEDERRFRRFLTAILSLTLALAIAIPLLPVPEQAVEQEVELPPRVAKLIFEKRTQPKPKPEPVKKKAEPEPVTEKKQQPEPKPKPEKKAVKKTPPPKPQIDRTEQARKKAASSGLLAMQDSLSDLRDDSSLEQLRNTTQLSTSGSQAKKTTRSMLTSKAAAGSQGINTSSLSRDTGGTRLAQRSTTRVTSPVSPVTGNKQRNSARAAARSIEEIQIVFDRNKGAIFAIYNRELRKNPALKGKLVLSLTIAPSGKVTDIRLVSSELGVPALEKKLLRRVKMFNFGAKPVDAVTVTYPIDFLPA